MLLPSRRGFLRLTLGTCWTSAALMEQSVLRAAQARAQAGRHLYPELFEIEKLAPGVFAAIAKPQVILNCNAVIFEQTNDLLVVDTHSKPSAVAALVQQIERQVSKRPVRYIVNSHFHWDHTQGAHAYRKLAPERPDHRQRNHPPVARGEWRGAAEGESGSDPEIRGVGQGEIRRSQDAGGARVL